MADNNSKNMIHSAVLKSITLTSDEILSLVEAIQADHSDVVSQGTLVNAYLKTIEKCLSYIGGERVGLNSSIYDDLMVAGMAAVIDAAKCFNSTLGMQFNGYAINQIKYAMQDERMRICGWNHKAVREGMVSSYDEMLSKVGASFEADAEATCDIISGFDFTEQVIDTCAISDIKQQIKLLSPFKAEAINIAFNAPQGKECGAVAKAFNISRGEAKQLIKGVIDELRSSVYNAA